MKKLCSIKGCILCGALLLGVVVFILSFFAKVTTKVSSIQGTYNNVIWGASTVTINGNTTNLGDNSIAAIAVAIIGVFLVLIATMAAIAVEVVLKDEKIAKWVVVGCGVLAIVGGILLFFTFRGFCANTAALSNGLTTTDKVYQQAKESGATCAMPVVMGILGIVAGLAIAASEFVPNKNFS